MAAQPYPFNFLNAISFYHNPDLGDANNFIANGNSLPATQLAKAANVQFNFGAGGASQWSIQKTLQDIGLYALQGVYVDNSLSPAPTILVFNGTNQTVTAPPFSQGYYRVLALNEAVDMTVSNVAAINAAGLVNIVPVQLLNLMPEGSDVWFTVMPEALQGTPVVATATGAAAILTATLPNVAGRRLFVTGFTLTGGGATAGLVVNATLAGADNAFGAAVTLNYAFGFPTGVAVAAQPLLEVFNPPLPILLGQAAVLTLPSGGAGNTLASISINGFYQ